MIVGRFNVVDGIEPTKTVEGYTLYNNSKYDIVLHPNDTYYIDIGVDITLEDGEIAILHTVRPTIFVSEVIESSSRIRFYIINITNFTKIIEPKEKIAKIFFIRGLTSEIPCDKLSKVEAVAA